MALALSAASTQSVLRLNTFPTILKYRAKAYPAPTNMHSAGIQKGRSVPEDIHCWILSVHAAADANNLASYIGR